MKDQSAVTHSRPRRTVKFQVQSGNTLPGLGPDFSFSVAAAAVRNSLTSKKNNALSPELPTWIAPRQPNDRVALFAET